MIYEPHEHHSIGSLVPEHGREARHQHLLVLEEPRDERAAHRLHRHRAPLLHDRIPKLLRCTINGVNSLAQWAALAAVTGDQSQLAAMRAEYRVRRDVLIAALLQGSPGVRPFTPRGAFYVWAELDPSIYERLGVADADELSDQLAANGIGSAPGDAFGQTVRRRDPLRLQLRHGDGEGGRRGAARALTDPDVLARESTA